MNIFKTNFSFHEDDEDTEDSGSDVEVKKSGRRHKLLRHKLSLSEGESGEEKAAGKEKKKGKKKSGRKGLFWNYNSVSEPRPTWGLKYLKKLLDDRFSFCFFICISVDSDDSADSDFEKSESSGESAESEVVSDSDNEDKRRKTRWEERTPTSGGDLFHCRWIRTNLVLFFLFLQSCEEEGWWKTEKLCSEEEATQDQSSGFFFKQWEGVLNAVHLVLLNCPKASFFIVGLLGRGNGATWNLPSQVMHDT